MCIIYETFPVMVRWLFSKIQWINENLKIFGTVQRVSYVIFSGDRCVEDIFIIRGCPMKYLVGKDVWRISSYSEGVL